MLRARLSVLFGILCLGAALGTQAAPTTLTVADSAKGTSNVPVTMSFPVTRAGDLGFDAVLNYHTADGTAIGGTDYTSATSSIFIPAGTATVSIPVTLSTHTGTGSPSTFQLILDNAVGIGPAASFATEQAFGAGTAPYAVAVADVNGDGLADLIVVNFFDNTVSVLLNTTAPGATSPAFAAEQTFAVGTNPTSVAVTDVNGDGKPDIVVTNFTPNTISVLLNTTAPGASTPSFAAQQTFATGSGPQSVAVADVNGDGLPDLVVANENGNTVSVLLNTSAPGSATATFASKQSFATGAVPVSVTTADVNHDGKPDLIVANLGDNTVSVLLNTTSPGAATPSFAAQQTFATGASTYSVTAIDLNGDGLPDLVVANQSDNTVSVLFNTTAVGATAPTFAAQETFATGASPQSVTAADLNGDGKPDLIVANANSNTVSVLLNMTAPGAATPSFASQQAFATGNLPGAVAVVDINGDGKPDLIVANGDGNNVSVLLNTTAPTVAAPSFAAQQSFATDAAPYSVAVADVNRDGKPDLILANNSGNTVSVLLNTTSPGASTPSFAAQQTFAVGSGAYYVVVADVNGDGLPDLITANINDNNVSVLLNTTAPGATTQTFAVQQTFATDNSPAAVTVADVDGDGKPDLIVADYTRSNVSVLINTTAPGATTPSFATLQTFAAGDNPISVTVADVNGDGRPDLIVANGGSNTVSVLLNTAAPGSAPSFAAPQPFATGTNSVSVAAADVNGDGRPDLIVANYIGNNVSVLLNTTAPGATTASFATQQTFATGSFPFFVAVTDVNGDGVPDVIVANGGNDTLSVLLNTTAPGATTPSFAAQQTFAAGHGPYGIAIADVNGDNKPDLAVADQNGNTVSVLLNTQLQALTAGSPATGTIVHDYIFANGFGN